MSRIVHGVRTLHNSIERLQFIKRARDVDFSLAEIKVLLAMQDNPCRNNSEVKALTAQHIVTLNEKIEQLQAMKSTLQVWHDSGVCQHSCHPYLNQATKTSVALTRLDRRTGLRAVG